MTGRRFLLLALLASLLFVGMAAYGDFRDVGRRLAAFPAHYFVIALTLAGLNFLLRFLRWNYYLNTLNVSVTPRVNLLVFLSGLALSVTPGKVGEFAKSYYLRSRAGVPVTTSIPAILMERVTDVIAVALLALSGLAFVTGPARWGLLTLLPVCGLLLVLASSRRSEVLLRLPGLRRWGSELSDSRQEMRRLTVLRVLAAGVGLAMLAWASEGLAFWVVVLGLGFDPGPWWAMSVYAAATIAGAVTTLPGGLVGTEGALTAFSQQAGAGRDAAVAATLLIRWATLWFAVAVGVAALALLHRRSRAGASIIDPSIDPAAGKPQRDG